MAQHLAAASLAEATLAHSVVLIKVHPLLPLPAQYPNAVALARLPALEHIL